MVFHPFYHVSITDQLYYQLETQRSMLNVFRLDTSRIRRKQNLLEAFCGNSHIEIQIGHKDWCENNKILINCPRQNLVQNKVISG